MKILAIDSTAVAASAAVLEDDRLLGEFFIHTSLTHSQTLMPMVQQVLECVGISVEEIDLFAACPAGGHGLGGDGCTARAGLQRRVPFGARWFRAPDAGPRDFGGSAQRRM